ncbi:hypothetical protein Poly24_15490 [Rosistilla carotiformis]|uniref:Uncharacterized protein n=1 Tax=Rosistilla carotiformis TaxID=2528017 RepID=A0A518JQN0_9BACT|nr:hypothetical protein [Rosistilla carotiformis]QDV67845.1 hypothetical protein Poly24_15490 [Rosistilla carotiformis]
MQASRKFLLATIIVGLANTATADWDSFWYHKKVAMHDCKIDYLRNQSWPQPFLEHDAYQARSPFQTMANNGWRLHNTLSHEVFRPDDSVLTAVGRNRVHWIATQTPQHHRHIYVLEAPTPDETQRRVASVEEALGSLVVAGAPPQVFVTAKVPTMGSGEWNAQLSRKRREQMVAPKLQSDNTGTN